MAMINVNRQTNDMFYRYKMPKLIAKVEGTGNGIKTVLVNITPVAKALGRPPSYVTKFFGCELGAQTQMYAKDDRYIVNGAHDCEKLQNLLDGFIKRFVLCPKCENPETTLSVRKRAGGEIHQLCKACGYQGTIIMASHKLTTYIAKNPPEQEGKNEGTAAATSETKTKEKSKKKNGQNGGATQDSDEGSPTENTNEVNVDDDGEDWGDDLEPSVAKLDIQIRGMVQSKDLEKPLEERCDQFKELLQKLKNEKKLKDIATVKDLYTEAERLEILEQAPFVAGGCLFTADILNEIDEYKLLLKKLCIKNGKGQKFLLNALETLVADHADVREKIFNKKTIQKIFLKLYDDDIVEEETFFMWHEKASKRYSNKTIAKEIRELSKEFIQWLKTADESTDEDDDDANNDQLPEPEIAFTHAAGNSLEVKIEKEKKTPVEDKIEYNGEIIDVDNI